MFHLSRCKLANTPLKCCSRSQGQMHFMLNIMNERDGNQAIQLYQHLSHFSDQIPDRNILLSHSQSITHGNKVQGTFLIVSKQPAFQRAIILNQLACDSTIFSLLSLNDVTFFFFLTQESESLRNTKQNKSSNFMFSTLCFLVASGFTLDLFLAACRVSCSLANGSQECFILFCWL